MDEPSRFMETIKKSFDKASPNGLLNLLATHALVGAILFWILGGYNSLVFLFIIIGIIALTVAQVSRLLTRVIKSPVAVKEADFAVYVALLGERAAAEKGLALSLTYLNRYERKNLKAKIALVMFSGALSVLNHKLPEYELAQLFIPLLLVFILIALKEWVVEYRIKRGLFGTNSSEVRDFISFLVQNSEDIDFTDSSGGLRKALLPEEQSRTKADAQSAAGGAIA